MQKEIPFGTLTLKDEGVEPTKYDLTKEYTRIGKQEKYVEICVDNPNQANTHCIINYINSNNIVKVVNPGKNDIWINDSKLGYNKKKDLRDGDVLTLLNKSENPSIQFVYTFNKNLLKRDEPEEPKVSEDSVYLESENEEVVDKNIDRQKKDKLKQGLDEFFQSLHVDSKNEDSEFKQKIDVDPNVQVQPQINKSIEKKQSAYKGILPDQTKLEQVRLENFYKQLNNSKFSR